MVLARSDGFRRKMLDYEEISLFPSCLSGGEVFTHVLQVDFHKFWIFLTF